MSDEIYPERTDGTFSRSDFTWDDENDRYICPGGKEMRHTWRTYSDPKHRQRLRPPMHSFRVQSKGSGATQEGRDALRPSQTHPRLRSAPITGPMRRSRRIYARSHRPKPSETSQAQANGPRHWMKGDQDFHIQKKSKR